ncbi:MAG TPA: O-succinylhomoserine sulfhydrylase [Chromatiaceae bacterium]|nr:O-succinylhomoserine sulfhydrylase [Chromatiaceae bacterium]
MPMTPQTAQGKAFIRPCTVIYLLLMTLTLVTWALGKFNAQIGLPAMTLSMTVLGIAMLKGHLIGDFFMGLRRVRGPWRWVVTLWLLLPASLITLAFMQAGQ